MKKTSQSAAGLPPFLDSAKVRFVKERGLAPVRMFPPEGMDSAASGDPFPVFAVEAFPRTAPGEFVHIFRRNPDGTRGDCVGMVPKTSDLSDPPSRAALDRAIRNSRLIPKILRILDLEESRYYVEWSVETDRGPRTFLMRQPHRNIFSLGGDRILLVDVEESQYEIEDASALDPHSLRLLHRVY